MSWLSDSTQNFKIRRQRFNIIEDLYLLHEVVNENPFAHPYKWEQIKESVCKESRKEFTVRAVRERVAYLIQLFKKEDIANLRRAATEEQQREKEMLLTEVIALEKNFRKTPLTQQKEKENGASSRDAAPETMKTVNGSADEESSTNFPTISYASTPIEMGITNIAHSLPTDERIDKEVPLISPPTPRGSKRKSSIGIQYLEKKLQIKMQLEEKRLRLEQEKLQFEKEKFQVEKCERMEAVKQLQQDREFQRQRDQQLIDLMNRLINMLEKERQ